MIDFKELVRDYFNSVDLQDWINHRFNDSGKCVVDAKIFDVVRSIDGTLFYLIPKYLEQSNDVIKDYKFDDIRKEDYVIDLGAHIGGFCLRAARVCKFITAVEPILTDLLMDNIELNDYDNIQVVNGAIGKNTVEWFGITKQTNNTSFKCVKELNGGCDFLKADCEGGEWYIDTTDLMGIRRIEMELHKFGRDTHKIRFEMLMDFFDRNYDYTFDAHKPNQCTYGIIHAEIK